MPDFGGINEAGMLTMYTNAIQIKVSYMDFALLFGMYSPPMPGEAPSGIQGLARVYMSPQQGKLLAKVLAERVAVYEAQFGEIKDPPPGVIGRASSDFPDTSDRPSS